eukprot:3360429-Rhodomonas_salina.1
MSALAVSMGSLAENGIGAILRCAVRGCARGAVVLHAVVLVVSFTERMSAVWGADHLWQRRYCVGSKGGAGLDWL